MTPKVTATFLSASGSVISTASTPEVDTRTTGPGNNTRAASKIPIGTRSINLHIELIRHAGSDYGIRGNRQDVARSRLRGPRHHSGTVNFDANTTFGVTGANFVNAGLMSIAVVTVTTVGTAFTNQAGG